MQSTDLVTTGGRGSVVRSWWAEALHLPDKEKNSSGMARAKGHRDEIEGKTFICIGDTFEPDGGTNRLFNTLSWEAGPYLELIVSTAGEPLTTERFSLRKTHYSYEWTSRFESGDARFEELTPITRRVMEMCSHEAVHGLPVLRADDVRRRHAAGGADDLRVLRRRPPAAEGAAAVR